MLLYISSSTLLQAQVACFVQVDRYIVQGVTILTLALQVPLVSFKRRFEFQPRSAPPFASLQNVIYWKQLHVMN